MQFGIMLSSYTQTPSDIFTLNLLYVKWPDELVEGEEPEITGVDDFDNCWGLLPHFSCPYNRSNQLGYGTNNLTFCLMKLYKQMSKIQTLSLRCKVFELVIYLFLPKNQPM